MSSRDDVPTLEEELQDLTVDDGDSTAPAEPEAPEPPESPDEASAESADDGAQPPAAAPLPPSWTPPEGGQPLAIRADGREFPVDGALRYEHGVYVPAQSWDYQVQRLFADREAFNTRYSQLQRQYEERDPEQHPTVLQAQASLQALQSLMDQGPEKVAEWLDNFQQNRALLEAQIQNQALQAQLEARSSQMSEVEHVQAAQSLAEQLPGYLKQNIDAAISNSPELQALAGQTDDAFQKLWPMADYLFVEADRDYPEYNLRRGQVIVHPGRLNELLHNQAQFHKELKRLESAAKQNQRSVAKGSAVPTVTTRGRPAPGDRSKSYAPDDRTSWKDDLRSTED